MEYASECTSSVMAAQRGGYTQHIRMPATLESIVHAARERAKHAPDQNGLGERARAHVPRGFRAALARAAEQGLAVIAELKKASPSKGLIRADFSPTALAEELAGSGAAALSVLTDSEHFQGSLRNLELASQAVGIPCIRKDFIVHPSQMVEARAYRADAVLLIVAALSDAELRNLKSAAESQKLDVLCEVHDEAELRRALDLGFDLIGVNNRDLKTFKVHIGTALKLGPMIPEGIVRVAESGINSAAEIKRLREAGYHAFLIGEALMKAAHPGEKLKEFLQ
jgi:indole-3-glycerol phosphate synthase